MVHLQVAAVFVHSLMRALGVLLLVGLIYHAYCDVFPLDGLWVVANRNGSITTSATVPGNIFTDLIDANILSDPYYGYNDVEYRWVGMDNWTYSRQFTVESAFTENAHVWPTALNHCSS